MRINNVNKNRIMTDSISYKGFVTIKSIKDGVEDIIVDDHNLTTTLSSWILSNILKQSTLNSTYGYEISKMKLSNMGSDDLVNSVPDVDPELEDMVGTIITTIDISSVDLEEIEGDDVVVFQAVLSKEEGNGKTFTEAGLFTEDGYLLAKKHFPSYQKDSSRELLIIWGIHFQRLTA